MGATVCPVMDATRPGRILSDVEVSVHPRDAALRSRAVRPLLLPESGGSWRAGATGIRANSRVMATDGRQPTQVSRMGPRRLTRWGK